MAYGINVVSLVGNLTRDVETRQAGDLTIAEIGIAVSGSIKRNGEWEERPDFFDVVVFGRRADTCAEYLSKGSRIAVSGRLRQERWETENGDKRSKVKIIADQIMFLGESKGGSSQGSSQRDVPGDSSDFGTAASDDDIPF